MKISIKRVAAQAAITMLLGASTIACAHGNEDHAKKAGPVKKEQKAWGIAAEAKDAGRTIEISMSDVMRFSPDLIEVKQGETVKFVIRNDGKMLHEFVLGTKKELDEHAALMLKFPGMEHDEPYMSHVPAGKAGEITWTFNRAGQFDFACLIAGHYQAGMVGKVKVAAAKPTKDGKDDGHADHKH
ncbi:cupredoxin family protein [Pelomonas sp. SE-A7]|uniref:cupredoxin domain-containing protein n=1 Tax=Pelomonas sp. SE-A7 TaxID=3054953 RepID=UPI00259CA536|nr:cupredoxin family protein [Pelomonas sp. SE-A7]MDM4768295.1 cupredoxin family protein [Pelomonas sp. SE-A7]